jgi:hypothetical protein
MHSELANHGRAGAAAAVVYEAYGVRLKSSFAIAAKRSSASGGGMLRGEMVDADAVLAAWSGTLSDPVLTTTMSDGEVLKVSSGTAGDLLVQYGTNGRFLIDPQTTTLLCSRADGCHEPAWQRVLLDWVMYFVASLRGGQALHASAAAFDGAAIAFCAVSGGGKTSAVLELLEGGAELVCDDVLCLKRDAGRICAAPGAPFINVVDQADRALGIGQALGEIGGEQWVHVHRAASALTPIAGVFLLDRSELHPCLRLAESSLFDLRRQAIGLPHLLDGELERFGLLSDLSEQAMVRRIHAPLDATPRAIVSLACEACGKALPTPQLI